MPGTSWLRTWLMPTFLAFLTYSSAIGAGLGAEHDPVPEQASVRSLVERATVSYTEAMNSSERETRRRLFGTSQQLFQQAIDASLEQRETPSLDLWIAHGNASLQNEDLGQAILAYRAAQRLAPANPQVLQNLTYARSLVPAWVRFSQGPTKADSLFFWHIWLLPQLQSAIAALCMLMSAGLLSARIVLKKRWLAKLALIPLGLWGIFLTGWLLDPRRAEQEVAIVMVEDSILRTADSTLSAPRLNRPLPSGAELVIVQKRPDWLEVDVGGRRGWLPTTQVKTSF